MESVLKSSFSMIMRMFNYSFNLMGFEVSMFNLFMYTIVASLVLALLFRIFE